MNHRAATTRRYRWGGILLVILLALLQSEQRTLFGKGQGQTLIRISINENGEQGNGISRRAALSADGRWVAFSSNSFNLTDEDQSPVEDVFLYDRTTGELAILSTVPQGKSQDGDSTAPRISGDGGVMVWESIASNFVPDDNNFVSDIFMRARTGGDIVRLSVNGEGEEGNGDSTAPDISADGNVVVFTSSADNLVPNDINGVADIFVLITEEKGERGKEKRQNTPYMSPILISVSNNGDEANGPSSHPRLSANGEYVVFTSEASNLVPNDTNGVADVFLYEVFDASLRRISVGEQGMQANGVSGEGALSADGRYVLFSSTATNLVPNDTNEAQDIFRYDLATDEIMLVSSSAAGAANGASSGAVLSANGRYVLFTSAADNLVAGDMNESTDIFRKDMETGEVMRLSQSANNGEGNRDSRGATLSADGSVIAFESHATNLVMGDTNGLPDIFATEVEATTRSLYLPLVGRDAPAPP